MMDLAEMVLHENAHSGLAFRDRAYGRDEQDQLIRDLIGLANAAVSGPRFLALGVATQAGGRQISGVDSSEVGALRRILPRIAARLIEPSLNLALAEHVVEGKRIAVIVVQGCDDPPYLLSRTLSPTLHAGRGWIRRGTELQPVVRDDLQRMFERKAPVADRLADLVIGFPGRILTEEVSLPALPLDAMPSRVAGERLQRMLEGKAQARDVLGRTETQFSRLLHAQLFGSDRAFAKHSDDSLIDELGHVAELHAGEDAHYEFEVRAHKLQLEIRNNGDFDIERASLVLTMMRLDGVGVGERVYRDANDVDDDGRTSGYPLVDESPRRYVVQAEIGRIAAGSGCRAFREPLRVWLREAAVGKTVLIDYKLQSRDLAGPQTGSLRIHVEAAQAPPTAAREVSGRSV